MYYYLSQCVGDNGILHFSYLFNFIESKSLHEGGLALIKTKIE
jgi:hypothetical protein